VTVEEDHASDRRVGVAIVGVMVAEVVLAGFADAGAFPLWVWLILTVVVVLVAGLLFALSQSRAGRGAPH